MANVCENPYKIARKMAGFTQERAAVLLNVSVDSLRDYEADLRPVPNDVAFAMCGVYNANHLAIEHLRMSSIGRAALPKFKLCELPVAVLGLLDAVQKFVDKNPEIIGITADGVISPEEQGEWRQILILADNLQSALLTVRFASAGEGRKNHEERRL